MVMWCIYLWRRRELKGGWWSVTWGKVRRRGGGFGGVVLVRSVVSVYKDVLLISDWTRSFETVFV
jgi:hypothetical protein